MGAQFIRYAVQIAWALPIVLALELMWPLERQSWLSRLRGAAMWSLYILFSAAILTLGDVAMRVLGIRPLFNNAPTIVAALLAIILADFFYYWSHRAQHRWFWRFHAVHHSIRELSAVNSYHHWTEELIRIPLVNVPVLLLAPPSARAPAIGLLVVLQTYYLHASTGLHFGPLRRIIADNRYHRIHHSMQNGHFDRNFAATFPVWDVLFGTVHWPSRDEWPATGVRDVAEPDGAADYLLGPFLGGKLPHLDLAADGERACD